MKVNAAGMDWDVCAPTRGHASKSTVTMNLTDGRLSISAEAFRLSKRPPAFLVLYSDENKSIGLKPATSRELDALLVSSRKRSGTQLSTRVLARRMTADGYTGTIVIPVHWHPDGLLWGDLTMAKRFERGAAKAKGVVA